MGLDIVEMVIALEDEFCVQLPVYELRKMETVGELFECVMGARRRPSSQQADSVQRRSMEPLSRRTRKRNGRTAK